MSDIATALPETEGGGVFDTLGWVARALLKRWPIAAALILLGGATALVYSKSVTRIYESSTLIEFDPDAIKPLSNKADPMAAWSRILDTREYYETQYKIIQSDHVLSIVARDLGLQNDPEFLGSRPTAPVPMDQIIGTLRGRLYVDPVKGSRLVYISMKDPKPAQARRLAEAVARAYVKQNLEKTVSASGDASIWLAGQLDHFKHELEQSENSLHEFKRENDLPSSTIDDLSKMIRLEMQEYDSALTHTRLRHSELRARAAELSKVEPQHPDEIPASELLGNAFLSQLRKNYQDAQRERAELVAEGKGENHPSVRRADEKLNLAREELTKEIRTIQGAVARDLAIIQQQENGEVGLYESARKHAVELNLKELEFHRLDRLRAQNEKLYATLLDELKETNLRRMMNTNNVRIVDLPVEARTPITPNVPLNLAVGLTLGLVLGIIAALIREALDNTLKTPDDIEKKLGLPFLGLLPEFDPNDLRSPKGQKEKGRRRPLKTELPPELFLHENPTSGIAEAARAVRTNLTFMNPDNPYRALLVTSAAPSEGRTTVAVSIAITLAQSGQRVCILDCDLRRPRLHRIFGRRGDVGLMNALLGEATLEEVAKPTIVPNLSCIPCGPIPPSSADVVASEKFRELLEELGRRFDRIVLDSPPIVAVTDSAILSTLVDGVVLVVRAFRTTFGLSRIGLRKLRDVDATVAGVVLNAVNLERDQYYYEGYYYYRRDGYAPHPANPGAAETPRAPSELSAGGLVDLPRVDVERSRPFVCGKWLLALLIPASALAVGTIPLVALLPISVVAAIALALVWYEPLDRLPSGARWILRGAFLLVAFTAVQAVPLPSALVHAIAPTNAEIWSRSLSALREPGPSFHPLSVSPVESHVQVLRGLLYLVVFLAALRVASLDRGQFLERVIIGSTVVMALIALAHPAVGAETVLGVYKPKNPYAYVANRYAPLLNQNHLAAYLNIGAVLALASAIGSRPALPRAILGASALLLAGTSVWAASRGGAGGLALGCVLVVVLTVVARRSHGSARDRFIVPVLVGVAAAALLGFAGSESARDDLTSTDLRKLAVAGRALRLALESPFFGFGRGAFEDVFPLVRTDTTFVTFTNPENIVAQWTVEWGFPITLLSASALLWALRPRALLEGVRPAIGPWVAIVISIFHDLVDFHLEVPGVMLPVCACAAVVITRRRSRGSTERVMPRKPFFALTGLTVAAVVWVGLTTSFSLVDERERASRMALDSSISPEEFRAEIRSAILRHPAEAFLPLMGAARAQTFGEGAVGPWVGAALERFPNMGRAHFVLARSLVTRNRSQARLEYRLAYQHDTALREPVLNECGRLIGGIDDAMELVVDGPAGVPVLEALSLKVANRLPSTARALDAELERRDPNRPSVLLRRAAAALSDLSNHHPWCADDSCANEAITAADAAIAAAPNECAPRLIRTRAAIETDAANRARAIDHLIESLDDVTDRIGCERLALQLMRDIGDETRVDELLDVLSRQGCGQTTACAELFGWMGRIQEERRRPVSALAFYKRAVEIDGDREDFLLRVLDIARRQNLTVDALAAAEALARLHPDDAASAAAVAELKSRVRVEHFAPSQRKPRPSEEN